jgi:glycosyltransferase involved in cell wall biosynthesis
MMSNSLPRMLVLSHVLPFPRSSGQQQRVYYTLQSARKVFHTTFASAVDARKTGEVSAKLARICDASIVLPSIYSQNALRRFLLKLGSAFYRLRTGLKSSNYVVGNIEFSPLRVENFLASQSFDFALFEYWHASKSTSLFRERNIPCVLDMHNILWQSYIRQMDDSKGMFGMHKQWAIEKYKAEEEKAWQRFDAIIAINQDEKQYVEARVSPKTKVFYAPMGTDLSLWSYCWQPSTPPRLAYYGDLGAPHNQQAAMRCAKKIMPVIWRSFPDAELWLVGSNPSASLQALTKDERIKVTGFVEKVQDILGSMSAIICPWKGTYGFRSRVIETMALGVPMIATSDAVYGMDLEDGKGILLANDDEEMANQALRLLSHEDFARAQSLFAREQVERLYSLENTYTKLMHELQDWVQEFKGRKS